MEINNWLIGLNRVYGSLKDTILSLFLMFCREFRSGKEEREKKIKMKREIVEKKRRWNWKGGRRRWWWWEEAPWTWEWGREWGLRLKVAIALQDAMGDCHVESHVALSRNGISWHIIYLPRICPFVLRSLLHVTTTPSILFFFFLIFSFVNRLNSPTPPTNCVQKIYVLIILMMFFFL